MVLFHWSYMPESCFRICLGSLLSGCCADQLQEAHRQPILLRHIPLEIPITCREPGLYAEPTLEDVRRNNAWDAGIIARSTWKESMRQRHVSDSKGSSQTAQAKDTNNSRKGPSLD